MKKGWSIDREDWEALEQVLPESRDWNSVLLTKKRPISGSRKTRCLCDLR